MKNRVNVFPISLFVLSSLVFGTTAFGQTEKLGSITYTPPKRWEKTAKDHAVVFSSLNPAEGEFGFITLYSESASEGAAQKDFAREWKIRVVDPWKGEANPKTETVPDNGWTAVAGGSTIDFNGKKAVAFLTVISGFGKTVSVLGITNGDYYLGPLQAFVEGLDIDKTPIASTSAVASTPAAATPTKLQYDEWNRLIIPLPTRQLTTADLAGQWGEDATFHQRYVYRSSGLYAGADSLAFKSKQTLTADGGYFDDFYAIQNGKLIKEKTGGSFAINGRVLVINDRNFRKYVIRGWLELHDSTVMVVHGPYYKDDAIPAEIFTNQVQGANLDKQWVRKK